MTTTVHSLPALPADADLTKITACAFCERDAARVKLLFVGLDGRAICDECVQLAAKAIAPETPERA